MTSGDSETVMAQEHDELFAKYSIQLKLLAPAQVMSCRDVLAELESAGVSKLLAVVAVDQGGLSRVDAGRLIDAINKKTPGKHPSLPPPLDHPPPSEEETPPPPPPPAPAKAGPPPRRP